MVPGGQEDCGGAVVVAAFCLLLLHFGTGNY